MFTKPPQTKRPCLRCERLFWSEGHFNRLCVGCNKANAALKLPHIEVVEAQVGRKKLGV